MTFVRNLTRRTWWLGGMAALLIAAGLFLVLGPPSEPEIDAELRHQIGQMLMVGFRGTTIDDPGPTVIRDQIAQGTVGGVLILGRNVVSLDALREMNRAFLDASSDNPPLIAVDQEGGRIQRLRSITGFPETPSAAMLGRYADAETALGLYRTMALALADLGFNVNFGPVVDLDLEPQNPIISFLERAYSPEPRTVTDYARAFIEAHREAGIVTAPKHFPGHGSTLVDSHEALPDISQSWSETELEPYRDLIGAGLADMVMVGHLVLDRDGKADGLPATLSPALITGLLREKMGYGGVIVSDDMEMGAIAAHHGIAEASIAAVRAGIDLIIVSNYRRDDPELPERLVRAIGAEAMRDPQLRAMIEASSARIATLKRGRLMRDAVPAS
jgi:beta-N-acetylhexosaminidase